MISWNKLTVKINEHWKWCTKCKKFLPFESFQKIRAKTPYASRCKECVRKTVINRNMEVFDRTTIPIEYNRW